MLDVINPSEGVWQSQLFLRTESLTAEIRRQSRKNRDIRSGDVLADEEHSLGHVLIDPFCHLLGLDASNTFHKLSDFIACDGVSLAEKHVFEVACARNLKHDSEWIG